MATGIVGSVISAHGQKAEAEYQAKLAEQNAGLASMAAMDATQRGSVEANKARTAGSTILGRQRVGLAASDVDIQSGSALNLQTSTSASAELDAQTVRNNAAREAWGYKVQGAQLMAQAAATRQRGKYAEIATLLGGAGSALSQASTLASNAYGLHGAESGARLAGVRPSYITNPFLPRKLGIAEGEK